MKVYITVNTDGTVEGWGSTPSTMPNEIELDLEPDHAFLKSAPRTWQYTNGALVKSNDLVLQLAKDGKKKELRRKCREAITSNFTCTVNGVEYTFSYDEDAQRNLLDYFMALANGLKTTIKVNAKQNGQYVRLDADLNTLKSIWKASLDHKDTNLSRLRDTLYVQVDSATTIDDVSNITW